ncbi:MAG: hypothetical protein R3C11_27240 [Planctomycetaceae bacterium]
MLVLAQITKFFRNRFTAFAWVLVTVLLLINPSVVVGTGTSNPDPPNNRDPKVEDNNQCYTCQNEKRDQCDFDPSAVSSSMSTGPGGTDPITNEFSVGAQDLSIEGPSQSWTLNRTYTSSGIGTTSLGNKWLLSTTDNYFVQSGSDLKLILSINSQRVFTWDSGTSTYIPPADSNMELSHDTTNKQFVLTQEG